jgi:hypothetical protein
VGGDDLANPYGVIPVNPVKFPHVKHNLADQFAKWLDSPGGQAVIAEYKMLGKQLFFPDQTFCVCVHLPVELFGLTLTKSLKQFHALQREVSAGVKQNRLVFLL